MLIIVKSLMNACRRSVDVNAEYDRGVSDMLSGLFPDTSFSHRSCEPCLLVRDYIC